jgi:hypothetical protein
MIESNGFKQIKLEGKDAVETFATADGLSLQSLFFAVFNEFPSLYTFRSDEAHSGYYFDTAEILKDLKNLYGENGVQLVIYTQLNLQTEEEETGINIYLPGKELFARIEKSPCETYILYRNGNEAEVEKLTDELKKFYKKPSLPPNNVYTVAYENGFYLNKLPTKDFSELDILRHYNNDFIAENEIIKKFIETDDDSGLLILHGDKGTGKSTYIRHLISVNPDKKFVYIPANLVSMLSQPNFSSFLMTLQNHIIILEDCEEAIKDRKSNGTPAAVALLLNLTDGLLSDGLGLKFICTFNDDIKNIDQALLRKGRLVSKYEFKNLDTEKACDLLKVLYWDDWAAGKYSVTPTTNKPLSLADIYHFYEASYEKERRSII